jgi:hypothetical protein
MISPSPQRYVFIPLLLDLSRILYPTPGPPTWPCARTRGGLFPRPMSSPRFSEEYPLLLSRIGPRHHGMLNAAIALSKPLPSYHLPPHITHRTLHSLIPCTNTISAFAPLRPSRSQLITGLIRKSQNLGQGTQTSSRPINHNNASRQ